MVFTIEKIYSKTKVKFKELEEITDLEKMDLKIFAYFSKKGGPPCKAKTLFCCQG